MAKKLLLLLVFGAVFAGFFFLRKEDAGIALANHLLTLPSVQFFGKDPMIEELLVKRGALVGLGLCILFSIIGRIILLLAKACRLKSPVVDWVVTFLVYGVITVLGVWLLYYEPQNSVLASSVIAYLAKPLLYAGSVALGILLIVGIASFRKHSRGISTNVIMVCVITCASSLLSGCSLFGELTLFGCGFIDDGKEAAHCYQEAAVQKNDPSACAKVPQGDEFKEMGSNPPKDKCYYMVAQNKRDPEICKNIKGGVMSYSASECMGEVLTTAEQEINNKLAQGATLSPEEMQKIQKQLADFSRMTDMMSNITKNMHSINQGLIGNLR